MISFQHVLALTSPPLSSPPLAASSRSTTPLAGNTTCSPQEKSLQPPAYLEGRHQNEPQMELTREIDHDRPRPIVPGSELSHDQPSFAENPRCTTLSIFNTANLFRERRYQQERCQRWRTRLQAIQKTAALTPRLLRTGQLVRKALVEFFKHGDKATFVSVYNAIHDIREAYKTTWRTPASQDDFGLGSIGSEEPLPNVSLSFMERLSPSSKADILEFLRLVRTSPEFLADRIGSLSSSQLLALTSSNHLFSVSESVLPTPSRGRSQNSTLKRTSAFNPGFSDRILDFERTDPLSFLLYNVFDLSQGPESLDSRLRLDIWASTCAKLLNGSGKAYYRFASDLAFAWTASREWSVRPRLELYLMDILEKGAFLLERIEDSFVGFNHPPSIDPLSTGVAEEFFESAVQDLFEVLDEPSGGMPLGALDLCNSILPLLKNQDIHDGFREFFFLQWYFPKYLGRALIYPEEEGMLLSFHVKKEARQLLHKVAIRAQMQAYGFVSPTPNTPMISESTRVHIDNMFNHISTSTTKDVPTSSPPLRISHEDAEKAIMTLSAMDIQGAISALVPMVERNLFSWDQHSTRSASSSLYSLPLRPEQLGSPSRPQSVLDHPTPGVLESQDLRSSSLSSTYPSQAFQAQLNYSYASTSQFVEFCKRLGQTQYELSNSLTMKSQNGRPHPCTEEWTVFSVHDPGNITTFKCDIEASRGITLYESATAHQSQTETRHDQEENDNQERLEHAIMELFDEMVEFEEKQAVKPLDGHRETDLESVDEMFEQAIEYCKSQSDYMKAHDWWGAQRLFHNLNSTSDNRREKFGVLRSLIQTSQESIDSSLKTLKAYEHSFFRAQRALQRYDAVLWSTFDSLAKLRDKMWYMIDVKHSLRYEEARNVALALKTMGYPATVRRNHSSAPSKFRTTLGSSNGSILQNQETQTMNIMKASSEQGGPNKLADEQVEMTRRWLNRSGIENFCQGEERIHRFCLEIKTSVSRIVGETMTDGPVLWASDLFQLERSLYDSPATRPPSVKNGVRPSSITSEEGLFAIPPPSSGTRNTEGYSRKGFESSIPPSNRLSSPSLVSERWRVARDKETFDAGSIDDSPGKAVSTSTAESYNTFWSPQPPKIRSSTSVSSFRSRPSSIYSEAMGQKAADSSSAKTRFLIDLRQTLTSLLLSDLGSPVWSMGSETDAWFSTILSQEKTRREKEREEENLQQVTIRRGSTRSLNDLSETDSIDTSQPPARQRSKSAQPSLALRASRPSQETSTLLSAEIPTALLRSNPTIQGFSYKDAFCRLLEKFSRHSNPFMKLNALDELRRLVLASLSSESARGSEVLGKHGGKAGGIGEIRSDQSPHTPESQTGDEFAKSSVNFIHPPLLPPFESQSWKSSAAGIDSSASPNAVINVLQALLREAAPKTLFRDLQFIATFVPSDILNKTDSGKAFLDAGVAALGLKQDVCQTMVEMADGIFAQEFDQRNPSLDPAVKRNNRIIEAANMWIITAKEGNPVAQRELAILYLTHPELLKRVTLPMTMPRETFKAEMMYRRNEDVKRSDPQTMCLALHWMQLSANGGDEVAKDNLREREEFDSIP